jgi:hypothetical protein
MIYKLNTPYLLQIYNTYGKKIICIIDMNKCVQHFDILFDSSAPEVPIIVEMIIVIRFNESTNTVQIALISQLIKSTPNSQLISQTIS